MLQCFPVGLTNNQVATRSCCLRRGVKRLDFENPSVYDTSSIPTRIYSQRQSSFWVENILVISSRLGQFEKSLMVQTTSYDMIERG